MTKTQVKGTRGNRKATKYKRSESHVFTDHNLTHGLYYNDPTPMVILNSDRNNVHLPDQAWNKRDKIVKLQRVSNIWEWGAY